jgi:hypothetical protein
MVKLSLYYRADRACVKAILTLVGRSAGALFFKKYMIDLVLNLVLLFCVPVYYGMF